MNKNIVFSFLKNREVWRFARDETNLNKVLLSELMTYDRALAMSNAFRGRLMIDWKEVG